MITLLNTSILTSYGTYIFRQLSLQDTREIIANQNNGFQSAIGHQATAEILTELLEIEVPFNRINYIQKAEESAIVFKLKERVPEGTILNREQIEKIGYEFGLLTRLK